jgi:negative regulator of flagellin synthesis FlgM
MQIYGPAHVHGAQQITAPHSVRTSSPVEAASSAQIKDEVQLSDVGQLISQVHDLPEMRLDRIAQLREQIASGNYMTDERMSVALDRMLDELV